MANARKELSGLVKFSEGLKDIGTSLTQYVTLPLAAFGAAAVAASGKIEGLKKGLEAITLQELGKQGVTGLAAVRAAAEQTTARMAQLQEIAKLPGLGFEGAVTGDVRLRAVGISAEQSAKSIKAFANAIATTGGGKSEFDRVTVQLAQLSAKGKVLAQDLRPIIEAAPAVSGALQRLYGTVDSETISASVAKQGKSSTDFVAVLTDELAKLPGVTGGLKNQFENFVDTGTLALAKFGDGISQALNLPGLLAGLSNFVERAANAFASLSPGIKTLVVALGGIAAATGPVLVAVGTLGAALPAISAGFSVLGLSSLAALGPLLPAAAAVAVAATLIYENWADLTAYFTSGEGATLFSNLAESASSAAATIGEAFSTIRANAGDNLGSMVSASGVFRAAFREATVGVTSVLNVLSGTISAITNLLTGEFSQAAAGARQAFYGLIDPIANLLGFTVRVQEANPILALSRHATEFNAVFPQLRANLDALNGVQLGGLAQQTAAAAKQIGLLADLEAKLKDAKATKEAATTEADVVASNLLIESLEKQVKRLNELGIGSKKAQEALAKLRTELVALTQLDDILARPADGIDVVTRRVNTLESGLKRLLEAGISPNARAFKAFAAEALTLQQGLAKLQASPAMEFKLVPKIKVAPVTIGELYPNLLNSISKELADRPLAVPFQLVPLRGVNIFPVAQQLAKDFQAAATGAEVFGGAFDYLAARADALKAGLQTLISQGISPTSPELQKMAADYRAAAEAATFNKAATDALKAGIMDLVSGVASAFGDALAGTASLGDALMKAVLQTVGKVATQLGQILVASGLGIESLKTALKTFTGVGAVVAGLGLIAIGGFASAAASKLGSSTGGSVPSISTTPASQPRSYTPTTAPGAATGSPAVTNIHKVQFELTGSTLRGALNIETDRLGRVLGR